MRNGRIRNSNDPMSRTGQFVVRQRESKIYSYIPENKKKQPKPEKSYHGLEIVYKVLRAAGFFLLAALTAFLIFKSYPKESVSLLAWFAFVPFITGVLLCKRSRGAALFGLLTGIFTYGGIFYWIYFTCLAGGLNTQLSALALFGLSLLISLQFVVFSVLTFYLRRSSLFFPVFAAMGWVTVEFLHQLLAYKFLGFPWFMLGYSQWNRPELLQIASYGGVYAISAGLMFVSACAATAITIGGVFKRLGAIFMGIVMFFGLIIFGQIEMERKTAAMPDIPVKIKVALLQPNIDLYKKWDAAFEREIEDTLIAQITTAAQTRPDIIIWPESALPGDIQDAYYNNLVTDLAELSGAYQVVGSNRFTDEGKQYVSAFFVNPQGGFDGIYSKETLVPFGEYMPLGGAINKLGLKAQTLGLLGSFTPGPKGQELMHYGSINFAVNICYESIFPAPWLNASRAGAKFFVNITNDGWYLDTSAPHQHLAAATVRAAELGLPVLRAANTGISAVIDSNGSIIKQTALNTRDVLTYELEVDAAPRPTFYSRWGNLFACICMLVFLTCSFASFVILDD